MSFRSRIWRGSIRWVKIHGLAWKKVLGLDPERSQMFWIVLVHYLREALQIVTIARVSTMAWRMMQQGLGFFHIHLHAYNILSYLINARTCMEVQHLQVEMVSIVCGVYTTQCVDRWRTTMWLFRKLLSILPAFHMCTHHYTTVGIPIFRHQLS